MKLSIIFVNYNAHAIVRQALNSVEAESPVCGANALAFDIGGLNGTGKSALIKVISWIMIEDENVYTFMSSYFDGECQ